MFRQRQRSTNDAVKNATNSSTAVVVVFKALFDEVESAYNHRAVFKKNRPQQAWSLMMAHVVPGWTDVQCFFNNTHVSCRVDP